MKKLLTTPFMSAFVLMLVLTLNLSTQAQVSNDTNNSGLDLKFIGTLKNQPAFQLSYNGATESEFTVVVRDQFNNTLYKDNLKGSNISKRFVLNMEELGDTDVTFEIYAKNSNKPVVFEVRNNTRYVQDVVVNKVK